MPLGDVVAAQSKDLNSLLAKSERLLKAKRLLDLWDIRVERNIAEAVFSRCTLEQLSRGLIPAEDEEQKSAALDFHQAVREAPHSDYLVGTQTLVELSDAVATELWMVAYRRQSCLRQIMGTLEGGSLEDLRSTLYVSAV